MTTEIFGRLQCAPSPPRSHAPCGHPRFEPSHPKYWRQIAVSHPEKSDLETLCCDADVVSRWISVPCFRSQTTMFPRQSPLHRVFSSWLMVNASIRVECPRRVLRTVPSRASETWIFPSSSAVTHTFPDRSETTQYTATCETCCVRVTLPSTGFTRLTLPSVPTANRVLPSAANVRSSATAVNRHSAPWKLSVARFQRRSVRSL